MTHANENYNFSSVTGEFIPPPPSPYIKRYVGNAALEHAEEIHDTTPEDFNHLFPAWLIAKEGRHSPALTAEKAETLLQQLKADDPYRDYATAELALHFMHHTQLAHANKLLHQIQDSATAIHVLCQLIMFEDNHNLNTVPLAELTPQLHDLALDTFEQRHDVRAAGALYEAAEALPNDTEIQAMARSARDDEHFLNAA